MLDWLVWPWEWTGDDWSGVQTLILLLAGVIAYWQASEARKLRLEQSRPFVIVDMDVRHTIAELKIKNIGPTLARDVRFKFNPPLRSTRDDTGTAIADLNLFATGIPSLAPGKEIAVVFDQIPARMAAGVELPEDYEVTITYEDPLGHNFSETMTVGYSHRINMVHRTRYDLSDLHKQLEEILKEMKKWTVRNSGIMVRTRADLRREDKEYDEYYEREAALARDQGAAAELKAEAEPSQNATSESDPDAA